MIRNYITIALRNLRRHWRISFINLIGLALGLGSCLVAALYIKYEYQTDQFHQDIQSIYRVTTKFKTYGVDITGTSYLLPETLVKEFPEVKAGMRLGDMETGVRINNEYSTEKILLADPEFFTFFTFPLAYGSAQRALQDNKQVVISHDIAQRYFRSVNPVGQIIQIKFGSDLRDFIISGVAAPLPSGSSIYFDFVIPLENQYLTDSKAKTDWTSYMSTAFIKIAPDDLPNLKTKLPNFIDAHYKGTDKGSESLDFIFHPFARHHLENGFSGSGIKQGRNITGLYVFAAIALVILVLACFNFMNLTNAQSSQRITEVGVRKVVGALRWQLTKQFLFEAVIMSFFASCLALGLAELSLILFQDLLQAPLSVFEVTNTEIYLGLLIVSIITGILAGSYPAFLLSNLSALSAFKRYYKIGGRNWITSSVLTFQFVLSIVLLVSAMVMWQQQRYFMEKDLGFNQEQVLVLSFGASDTASIKILKNEFQKQPEVISVSRTSGTFTRGTAAAFKKLPDQSTMFIFMQSVDEDFFKTLDMKFVKGSGFDEKNSQSQNAIVVNETLAKKFNIQDSVGYVLGQKIGHWDKAKLSGIVKDFHNFTLREEIGPFLFVNKRAFNDHYLMVRLAPNRVASGVEKARQLWSNVNPNSPFEFFFLDDDMQQQYQSELQWSRIITLGTGMAIFLSMLGLVGLAMFTAEQRRKEVSIRKVLGASINHLIVLLSRDYLVLIVIAFIIGGPLAYYGITNYWLNEFAYKIDISALNFVLSFFLIIAIAFGAVAVQLIRAAIRNPANTLKEQ